MPAGGLGPLRGRGGGAAKGGAIEKPGAAASGSVRPVAEGGQREEPSSRLGTPRHGEEGS